MENKVKFKAIEKFVNEHNQMKISRIAEKSVVVNLSNKNVMTVTKERGLFSLWLSVVDENGDPVYSKGFKKQKDIIEYLERKYK